MSDASPNVVDASRRFGQGSRDGADGGGGPHDPGMDVRIARLEDDAKELRTDMKRVLADLGYIKGRIEQLPSTWVMITGLIGSQIALAGLILASSRLLGHG